MALFDPSQVASLLARCPRHQVTPLLDLVISKRGVRVKDESARMGLGSFKALGGAYAALRLIERAGTADLTFVTASAGNHGLSVAAGAQAFGARARIYLSATVPEPFAARLRALGAEVVRSGADYEASVRAAIKDARETGACHLADGSWPGYTEPPRLVMEGYTVIAEELASQLRAVGTWPDAVYLHAGVGGMAAAVTERIRAGWDVQPRIAIVEPEAAPCLKASVAAGQLVTVEGPVSALGRLDCKQASMLAYEILRDQADSFVTVSEAEAEHAACILTGAGHATTPSGAAGLAACLREDAAHPLIILSEGAE